MKFITLRVYYSRTHVFDNTLYHCNGSIFIASLSHRGGLRGVDRFFNKHRAPRAATSVKIAMADARIEVPPLVPVLVEIRFQHRRKKINFAVNTSLRTAYPREGVERRAEKEKRDITRAR